MLAADVHAHAVTFIFELMVGGWLGTLLITLLFPHFHHISNDVPHYRITATMVVGVCSAIHGG